MKGLQQNRSVPLYPARLSIIANALTTSLMDIPRTQVAILVTAAGTFPQQTTSGGPDRGAHVPVPVQEAFRDEWWSVKMLMVVATVTVMRGSNLQSPRAVTLGHALCGIMASGESAPKHAVEEGELAWWFVKGPMDKGSMNTTVIYWTSRQTWSNATCSHAQAPPPGTADRGSRVQ